MRKTDKTALFTFRFLRPPTGTFSLSRKGGRPKSWVVSPCEKRIHLVCDDVSALVAHLKDFIASQIPATERKSISIIGIHFHQGDLQNSLWLTVKTNKGFYKGHAGAFIAEWDGKTGH